MNKLRLLFTATILGIITITGCNNDDDTPPTTGNLTLKISGLEDLGNDFTYEGWLIVNGTPVSAGTFNVNSSGTLSKTSFEIGLNNLDIATAYILTIEPSPDNDPMPSSVHILAGDFSENTSSLTVGHKSALGDDFSTSTGGFILATPTDGGMDTNEKSGVWWLDPAGGTPSAGLSLPVLPAGWKYEGWAVIDNTPVTTGKFLSATGADDSAPTSKTVIAPPFPGEDFLINAPTGLTFPTDLAGKTVVISVEPNPDNSPAPFLLKPLVGDVPASAIPFTLYMMSNKSSSNPSGKVSR